LIRIQVDTCKARAQEAVKTALDLETTPPYTQNTHYLKTLREKWLVHYQLARRYDYKYEAREVKNRVVGDTEESCSLDDNCIEREWTPTDHALRALATAGYANLQASDLARLLPPDAFGEELVVMADVRAYYHVAYKVSRVHQLRFQTF